MELLNLKSITSKMDITQGRIQQRRQYLFLKVTLNSNRGTQNEVQREKEDNSESVNQITISIS